ncbi:MAG TPA: iron ABC transporter permease [Polyangia bacterium]|nr:iron ABC transporter permease [Polyangia bacterium]
MTSLHGDGQRRRVGVILGLVLAGVALMLVGLCVGSSGNVGPGEALARLFAGEEILAHLRAPRVGLAAIVGASLATAGVGMQAILRNPLAEPYVLGVSGGASLGAVASLALWPGLAPGPAAAAGAAATIAAVRAYARGAADPLRLLLAGVAFGSALAALTGIILVLAPPDRLLRAATFWLFGGFGTPPPARLLAPALLLAAAFAWLWRNAQRLDRLALGDEVAAALGVSVSAVRGGALLAVVVLTASAVAVGGLVGFVGLMAPHAARRLVGAGHRRLLPVAALLGALLVLAGDIVARRAFAPRELPVGLLTALVGGPFFLSLLHRARRWT